MSTIREAPPPRPRSNRELAALLDCDYTTISRLRNGQRIPGITLTAKIIEVFRLSVEERGELLSAMCDGAAATGEWLNDRCFGPAPVPD